MKNLVKMWFHHTTKKRKKINRWVQPECCCRKRHMRRICNGKVQKKKKRNLSGWQMVGESEEREKKQNKEVYFWQTHAYPKLKIINCFLTSPKLGDLWLLAGVSITFCILYFVTKCLCISKGVWCLVRPILFTAAAVRK